jgi:NAD(P)-dependent dehydrogenase (short-subunit alcohol dehydrogenase family)
MEQTNVAVVTGAGSGVGRSTAIALVKRGWNVALLGRREAQLRETAAQCGAPERSLAIPCDVADEQSVRHATDELLSKWGRVDALVCAAGTNAPNRSLAKVSPEDYRTILDVNLHGVYLCVQALLPAMRRQRRGSIVVVNSIAGLRASALSGVAYVMSKFGAAGLVQSINAEENAHGIRATSVFPGDIDTPLLERRPSPPPPEARTRMLTPDDVAACVMLAIDLPDRAVVEEIVVRPRVN